MDINTDEWGQVLNAQGFIPARRRSSFALGLDLGQTTDPTALVVVEKIIEPLQPLVVDSTLIQRSAAPRYELRWLERFPLQTSYIDVVACTARLLGRAPLAGNCRLVIDLTGVGRAVGDLFSHSGLPFVGVTITGGQGEARVPDGSGWHVAKIQLVSRLQALLHSEELRIAKGLPEAPALVGELQNFRATISDAGFASFGARSGKHDDLVLALAIALWWLAGPRGAGRMRVRPLEL